MSFCTKCGREIMDESLGCPICSMMETPDFKSEEPVVEKVDSYTVEDEDGVNQRFEREEDGARNWGSYEKNISRTADAFKAAEAEQTIPTVLKVIIIIAILLVGGVGQIAGLIAGIILLKSPVADYRKFGKTLVTLSVVLLGIWLICCLLGGVFNFMALSVGSIAHNLC